MFGWLHDYLKRLKSKSFEKNSSFPAVPFRDPPLEKNSINVEFSLLRPFCPTKMDFFRILAHCEAEGSKRSCHKTVTRVQHFLFSIQTLLKAEKAVAKGRENFARPSVILWAFTSSKAAPNSSTQE